MISKYFDARKASGVAMNTVRVGISREMKVTVGNENAISFLGNENARVLSTPSMIMYMEITSRDMVKDHLEPGHDTVGTHVDVRHLAATPLGMEVRFRAEVIGVEDRRIRFKVEAFDDKEKIGDGTH